MSKIDIIKKRREMFEKLSDEKAGAMIKHIVAFAFDGELTNVDDSLELPCYLIREEMIELDEDGDEEEVEEEESNVVEFKPRRAVSIDQMKTNEDKDKYTKVLEVINYYKEKIKNTGLQENPILTNRRISNIHARIKEYGIDGCKRMIDNLPISPYCLGYNDNGWKASFDWLFMPTNFVKVLEGNYVQEQKTEEIIDVQGGNYDSVTWQQ